MKTSTLLLGGSIATGLYFVFRGFRKQQGAENLKVDVRDVGTPKFEGGGLIIPLQIVAINSSPEDFVIQYPTVRAYFPGGSDIGVSLPKDENLTIKPNSSTTFPMEVKAGAMDLLSLITGELFDVVKNKSFKGKTIKLDVTTAWNGIPLKFTGYEKKF